MHLDSEIDHHIALTGVDGTAHDIDADYAVFGYMEFAGTTRGKERRSGGSGGVCAEFECFRHLYGCC